MKVFFWNERHRKRMRHRIADKYKGGQRLTQAFKRNQYSP